MYGYNQDGDPASHDYDHDKPYALTKTIIIAYVYTHIAML